MNAIGIMAVALIPQQDIGILEPWPFLPSGSVILLERGSIWFAYSDVFFRPRAYQVSSLSNPIILRLLNLNSMRSVFLDKPWTPLSPRMLYWKDLFTQSPSSSGCPLTRLVVEKYRDSPNRSLLSDNIFKWPQYYFRAVRSCNKQNEETKCFLNCKCAEDGEIQVRVTFKLVQDGSRHTERDRDISYSIQIIDPFQCKMSFLIGNASQTPVRTSFFLNPLFDRNVLREIFAFLRTDWSQ